MTAIGYDPPRSLRPRGVIAAPDPVEHLEPLLAEYAELGDGPERDGLRERLVAAFLPVTRELAARYRNLGVPEEDLVQIAAVGLVKALNRYEHRGRGTFLAFAESTILGEIRSCSLDNTWSVHIPWRLKNLHLEIQRAAADLSPRLHRAPRPAELAGVLNVPLQDVVEAVQVADAYHSVSLDQPVAPHEWADATLGELLPEPRDPVEDVDRRYTVRALVSGLDERDRTVVRLRFYAGLTQSQIGERLGISQMHVSRLLSRILTGMRAQMEG